MGAFTCPALFPFALIHPFCCTAHGQLLVCCMDSHVLPCN
jgi:hypothetical protein